MIPDDAWLYVVDLRPSLLCLGEGVDLGEQLDGLADVLVAVVIVVRPIAIQSKGS